MIYFNNDYSEGCHPKILEKLSATNFEQTYGYGMDDHCSKAAKMIRDLCGNVDVAVHFLVGGTQTNLTVIASALRPYQAAVCAATGHIHVHETGAVEATGHKIIALPSADGKVTAQQVQTLVSAHRADEAREHTAQPKLVYISNPTELGTIYSRQELVDLSRVCRDNGLYLFLDGARLGYGLTARDNDLTIGDIAQLCDAFYIGGTKVGALFGEAVVISSASMAEDFRYMIKRHGGMLAKGRLLGIQFETLLENGLYFEIARGANALADQLRDCFAKLGYPLLVPGTTNQVFPVIPDSVLEELSKEFSFTEQERVDDTHRAVRFCTSWATKKENVDLLCEKLEILSANS